MVVLLTGASGFIGTHTAQVLTEKKVSFLGLNKTGNGDYKKIDLKNPFNIRGDFSGIIHLAAKEYLEQNETVEEYFSNNFLGTVNILNFCRKKDIPRIVFSSTMSVYGKAFSGKISEKTKTNPKSPYAESKKHAEDAIIDYSKKYGIDYAILRYSTVFGPGQRSEGKLVEIFDTCLANKPIFFNKDSARNFVYAKDVARANFLALKSKKNCTLNIAESKNISWAQAASIIKKMLKSDSKINIGEKSRSKFKIDIGLARKTIGFSPEFSFQEGIKETFETGRLH